MLVAKEAEMHPPTTVASIDTPAALPVLIRASMDGTMFRNKRNVDFAIAVDISSRTAHSARQLRTVRAPADFLLLFRVR